MKTLFRIGVAWVAVYILATSILFWLQEMYPALPVAYQTLVLSLILVTLMMTLIIPNVNKLANRLFG